MKRNLSIIAILVTGLTSSLSMAADTGTLAVTATVTGKCKFQVVGGLTFATPIAATSIDPSENSNATGAASITYRCTNGTSATGLTLGVTSPNYSAGHRVAVVSGVGPFMAYTHATAGFNTAGTGFGAGNDKTGTVTGTILQATHQAAVAGTYTDSVSITINP